MMGEASRQKGERRMFVGLRNALLLSVCLMFAAGQAGAVALGKIEVTSHLGEDFFAEAPLQLDAGEKISDVTVEMAAPSDYQILEVFRDPALSNLSVDIVNDLRGPRATISSNQAIDTPYFNLVLKLRHGHATNFKKYPVFLDLPEKVRPAAIAPVAQAQPVQAAPVEQASTVSSVDIRPVETAMPAYEAEPAPAMDAAAEAAIVPTGSEFNPYEGWARTSRYGPMVRGDTVTTVAKRLRIDERYTLNQVMVGLFNKNKEKFREGNINLINAGTYLNVPSAEEVESVPASQAEALIKQQEQQWKSLRSQPVYAAEAEAQKNRYRTRVHVGQSASGSAAAPMQQNMQPEAQVSEQLMPQGDTSSPFASSQAASSQVAADQVRALQEENLRLQQALEASEAKASSAVPSSADAAAAGEQVKKLELTVARLQRQLTLVNQEMQEVKSQDMNALTYAMGIIIVLLIGVAGYLMFLLRRDRPHPETPVSETESVDVMQADEPVIVPAVDAAADDLADAGGMDSEAFAASLDAESGVESGNEAADDSLLFENKVPPAQAGVDYLAEAEVYLRYGMDEEALQQMHLAIEQKPDQLEAHSKLVQFLQSRGDQLALAAAIEAARSALGSSDLEAFEKLLPGEAPEADDLVQDMDEEHADGNENAGDALDMGDFGDLGSEESVTAEQTDVQTDALSQDESDVALTDMAIDLGDVQDSVQDESEEQGDGLDFVSDTTESNAGPDASDATDSDTTTIEEDADDAVDFVSSIDISEPETTEQEDAADADVSEFEPDSAGDEQGDAEADSEGESQGIAFASAEASDDDAELDDVLNALSTDDDEPDAGALDFETSEDDTAQDDGEIMLADINADNSDDDDDLGLDAILGEFEADSSDEASGVDFASAGSDGISFQVDAGEESVPETVIDTDTDDDLGIDAILGEFAMHESEDETVEISQQDDADESFPETIIESDDSDDDLGLDDILGEFENYAVETEADAAVDDSGAVAAASDVAEMPDMDVSDELDGLLAEWGEEDTALDFETGPESLDIDKARSLLAEGSLDDAETALQSAVNGERRGDALIGLAEVAAKRGDAGRSSELLAEAESLLDDSNREWFDSVKNLSA